MIWGMLRVKREESDLGAVRSYGGICGWTSKEERQNLCGVVAWQDPYLLQLAPLLLPFSAVIALAPQYPSSFYWWNSTHHFLAVQLLVLFLPNQKPTRGQSFGDSWCVWGAKTERKIWDWAGECWAVSSFIFTVYSASERVRFGHRPESYGFLPWCLVPDQNQVLFFFFFKTGFLFSWIWIHFICHWVLFPS